MPGLDENSYESMKTLFALSSACNFEIGNNSKFLKFESYSKRKDLPMITSCNENRFVSFNRDPQILSSVKKSKTPLLRKTPGRDGVSQFYENLKRRNRRIEHKADSLLYDPKVELVQERLSGS